MEVKQEEFFDKENTLHYRKTLKIIVCVFFFINLLQRKIQK